MMLNGNPSGSQIFRQPLNDSAVAVGMRLTKLDIIEAKPCFPKIIL